MNRGCTLHSRFRPNIFFFCNPLLITDIKINHLSLKMSINNRIKTIRDKFCDGDNTKFAEMLGTSVQYASNICNEGKKVGSKVLDKILNIFPEVNAIWLKMGEGGMLKNESTSIIYSKSDIEDYEVPLLPISSQGGSLNDFVISVKEIDCEKIISPIRGATFAITVTGDSMAPEYPSGSQILIKKINDKAFIEWGRVYVLDTCNGVIIKRIIPSNKNGYIQCISDNNPMIFAPFDVDMKNIFGIL